MEIKVICSYSQICYIEGNIKYTNLHDIFHGYSDNRIIIKSVIRHFQDFDLYYRKLYES